MIAMILAILAVMREWMSLDDLEQYSGLCKRTLQRYIGEGLPCVKLNQRTLRVSRTAFDAWMNKHAVEAHNEADEIVDELLRKRG